MEDAKSLERSLRLLFELARNPGGLSVTELARRLGTQRPPLYRQLQTLSKYRMIRRDEGKLYKLGTGILELAQYVTGSIADEVGPALQRAADAASLPALLLVADKDDLVTLVSVRPSVPGIYLETPAGFIHPEGPTAPRLAIRALQAPSDDDSDAVRAARESGFALTRGVAAQGRSAIAAGVRLGVSAQLGAVLMVTDDRDEARLARIPEVVTAAAHEIQTLFTGGSAA